MKNKIKYYQMFESKDKTNVVIFEVINKFNYLKALNSKINEGYRPLTMTSKISTLYTKTLETQHGFEVEDMKPLGGCKQDFFELIRFKKVRTSEELVLMFNGVIKLTSNQPKAIINCLKLVAQEI